MHNKKRFNDWAKDYNSSVDSCKDGYLYPFAGYDELMNEIHHLISINTKLKILDVWDEDEHYIKYNLLEEHLEYQEKEFKTISFCSGIIKLQTHSL